MFQRLQKGLNLDFLDNKIAEEQEKQKQNQQRTGTSTAKRTSGNVPGAARRPNGRTRTASPSKRTSSSLRATGDHSGDGDLSSGPAAKGPDPDSFVIGDDASDLALSRTATPALQERSEDTAEVDETMKGNNEDTPAVPAALPHGSTGKEKVVEQEELPLEIRQKLARLDTLTTRYQDLLRNYRTAHAHVAAIEPFEATLREHTPLTSIADPGALVEFLNQRTLQSEMVMQELKRVSGERQEAIHERDELKIKLDEAEQKAKDAFDEAAGLRSERDKRESQGISQDQGVTDSLAVIAETKGPDESNADTKVLELQDELKLQQAQVEQLSAENTDVRRDLESTRGDLEVMQNKLRDNEENVVKDLEVALSNARSQLEQAAAERDVAQRQEEEATTSLAHTEREVIDLQHQLTQYRDSSEAGKKGPGDENVAIKETTQREAKQIAVLQNLVTTLRIQLRDAEQSKESTESKVNDLQFEIKKLESEISSSSAIIAQLRRHEAAAADLTKKISEAEVERDEARRLADVKKVHEAAVASMRGQLRRAEKDRDAAYQMILDCGKCEPQSSQTADAVDIPTEESLSTPESRSRLGSQVIEASTLPTEASTPSIPSIESTELTPSGEAKKKNKKKKSKAKKKTVDEAAATQSPEELTLEDLLRNPKVGQELLLKARFGDNPMVPLFANIVESAREKDEAKDGEKDGLLQHHEAMIEELKQNIIDKDVMLKAKSEDIIALQERAQAADDTTSAASVRNTQEADQLRRDIVVLKAEIAEKDEQIGKLQERIRGEASLLEEIEALKEDKESLQEDILEHGTAATNAKHELKELRDRRDKLQKEFDELEQESSDYRRKVKDELAQKDHLSSRCSTLESELVDLNARKVSSEELEAVKEQLQNVEKQKESVEVAKKACEMQIEELKAQHTLSSTEFDARHESLSADFEQLTLKATETEKELAAAHQLAQTRFKDLTIVRDQYNKLQPELKKLREDFAESKTARVDLEKASSSIKRLEAKEKDLKSEIAEYKAQASAKEREVSTLKEETRKSGERSTALEESYENARRDLERSEATRNEAVDKHEKLKLDSKSNEEELKATRLTLEDLEQKAKKFSEEASGLREELQLRSAQQASAQSLMDSMQDQTRELTTRMREAEDRRGSLEEELADAHRLLSERSREGETMRRLLADVEGRAESKVKEMREQMELAVQERDRAEDEASTIGRRKAREIEELRTQLREAEREASRAQEARQDAERQEREYRSRQEDLSSRATQAQEEVNEIRTAMAQLRDTLDETEQQSRALEKNKADMRRTIEERDARLEKLHKSSRSMAEELRALQAASKLRHGGSATPSRSSMESSRVTSPLAKQSNSPSAATKEGGVDYVYLKNVLLQFLEQKEKRYQMQLIPVLGMILHFDKQEEQKWMSAISAK